MADGLEFKLEGAESLAGKLRELKSDVRYKGGRAALRKAANIVVDHAKAGAQRIDDPETKENIAANIVLRWNGRLYKRTGQLGFRVGVLGGAGGRKKSAGLTGLPGGDTRHWRLLEFGTEKMRAQPFMRSALADHISQVVGTFVTQYEKAIDRALKRAAKAARGST